MVRKDSNEDAMVVFDVETLGPRSVQVRWTRVMAGPAAAAAKSWNCGACTLENDGPALECVMCGTSRDEALGDTKTNGTVNEYQIKYHRDGRTLSSWRYSEVTTQHEIVIEGLDPNTLYKGVLRYRAAQDPNPRKKAKANAWTEFQEFAMFKTYSSDEALRVENLERVDAFLQGQHEPYPEDEARPDGVADKLSRAGSTLLQASGVVGVGGAYGRLARSVYALHRTGLSAIIFREDIQAMVVMLATNVGQVAKEFGLSRLEITAGCYYMLWEHKRERLLAPDLELQSHTHGQPGVLEESGDLGLLDEAAYYYGFSQLSYRSTPAEIQWVLRNYPQRDSDYKLVSTRVRSEKFRPAFALMASDIAKEAVLSIRGTQQADDFITDFTFDYEEAKFRFQSDQTYRVHAGMLRAARWMLKGNLEGSMREPRKPAHRDVDLSDESGAGMGLALARLHKAGYKITFTGHSLGAGVATLLALLIADEDPTININVYGFGSPACVDEALAEACKGRFHAKYAAPDAEPVTRLGDRVTVLNFVFRDDVVSRLSLFNARLFAADIKRLKPRWGPLLKEDRGAYTSRAFSLWAPQQRGNYVGADARAAHDAGADGADEESGSVFGLASRVMKRFSVGKPGSRSSAEYIKSVLSGKEPANGGVDYDLTGEDGEENASEDDDDANAAADDGEHEDLSKTLDISDRMAVAGIVLHAYTWRGAELMAVVDYRFKGLRRLGASQSLISDHRNARLPEAFRNVRAARALGDALSPPPWQSIEDHLSKGLFVKCSVCRFFVGWHHTGDSEAVEVRAAKHCRALASLRSVLANKHEASRYVLRERIEHADGGRASAAVVDDRFLDIRLLRYGDSILGANFIGKGAASSPFSAFVMMGAMAVRIAERQAGDRSQTSMLQLGLGAGTVPSIAHLRGAFGRIDAVENSTSVARLAVEHMDYHAGKIYLADAHEFIMQPAQTERRDACDQMLEPPNVLPQPAQSFQGRYALVAQDLYMGWNPMNMLCREVFRRVKNDWLDPLHGVYMVNLVAVYRGPHAAFFRALVHTLQVEFPFVSCYRDAPPAHDHDLPANLACLASTSAHLVDMGDVNLRLRAANLTELDPVWVDANFHHWRVFPLVHGDEGHSMDSDDFNNSLALLSRDADLAPWSAQLRFVEEYMRELVRPMLPDIFW
ncbi:Hypothetical Protein FCC1311_046972 [Hondaea fermentalgiana]|uniref:sn-1-specific diacylglycerol lipase n=1 Tax=Hondaea fermentalgiana TaxID=2315210 RepID=A0A2R5GKS6_9STRA|nr:Hypothetical Protein FCC1311_046972 [Hondaea fermentalgiana]|eukprot:GBG28474.1 Hypothetical Protein FCC1311_046972 [Hondaea fermentalgiana]